MASLLTGIVSESTRVSDDDERIKLYDILFSFEFFALLILLLLNSNLTVNLNRIIQTSFQQSIYTGQFRSKRKAATLNKEQIIAGQSILCLSLVNFLVSVLSTFVSSVFKRK